MKRRELIKLSGLALAGTALPNRKILETDPSYHFIGVGSWGGRILEAFESFPNPCKYTWLTDQDGQICDVEGVKKLNYEHLYTAKYFRRNRIKELPTDKVQLSTSNLNLDESDVHLILSQPACFLSYSLIPQLVQYMDKKSLNHHSIIIKPFRFYSEMWQKSVQETEKAIGDYPGKLTMLLADSVVERKKKMMLDEAFKLTCRRVYEEFTALRNRNYFAL